jgi:hypothetical protein
VDYSSKHRNDRNPGGNCTKAYSNAFIRGTNVDDEELFIRDEDVYDFKNDFNLIDSYDTSDTTPHTDMKVSLLDIARPAKKKG